MDRPEGTRATAVDVGLALGFGALGTWYAVVQSDSVEFLLRPPVAVQVAAQLLAAGSLLLRRHRPMVPGTLVALLCPVTPVQSVVPAAYAVAAHTPLRAASATVLGALLAAWCLGAQVWQLADPWSVPLLICLAAVLGLYRRARRTLLAALVDRAERAEREQRLLAERAVAQERSRLAGEMHDVVSSRLSLMLLQAGAMSTRAGDPAMVRSIEELRENGVAALTELQDVFGTLRTSPPGTPIAAAAAPAAAPPPGTPAAPLTLDPLAAQWRAAGMPLTVTGRGIPELVDAAVRRTAVRVVQEALTNAGKHAPGAAVVVEVDDAPAGVRLTVRNGPSGSGGDPALAGSGGGWGLTGLAERVRLVGGTLEWGATASGGFELSCRLPATVPAEGGAA